MKKLIFTLFISCFILSGFAQTTYYYVGGNGPVSYTLNSNWSTVPNSSSSGDLRVAQAVNDILIIDGSNVGGSTPLTGPVTLTVSGTAAAGTCGQLKIINGATVFLQRPNTGAGGTGTLTVQGDPSGDDFIIDAGCALTLNSPSVDGSITVNLGSTTNTSVTGRVSGTLTMTSTGAHRLGCFAVGGLVFTSTAVLNSDLNPASGAYPLGGSTGQSANLGAVFQSGASVIHTGKYSPLGSSSTFQAIDFQPGSNYYFRTTNAVSTGSYVSSKVLSNFYVQNNSTFTADGTVYKFDKLIVENGSTYITHTSGSTPVLDTLRVEGTLTGLGTNALVLGGVGKRDLPAGSGTGTINVPTLFASEFTTVTLKKNITVSTSVVLMDSFDFGNNKIISAGTFNARGVQAPNTTYTATVITNGSNQITVTPAPSGLNGLTVTGAGIQPNTVVLAFASSGVVNLSKPANVSGAGVPLTFFTSSPATLITNNINGFDSTSGTVTSTGTKTFNSGVNYVFNAATTQPFNLSPYNSTSANNVTFNAAATTNRNVRINGILTLNSGNLTVRPVDSLYISSTGSIANANASKYVVTDKGATSVGVLSRTGFTSATSFPVGSPTRYMPVSITPQSGSADFSVSIFEGITAEGTVDGTPYTPSQKADAVDAVWTINRNAFPTPAATAPCDVTINWDAALEGSNFSAFPNVGITHHNGVLFEPAIGTGNNTTNTATATFSSFSPFSIAQQAGVVPVQFINIAAAYKNNTVNVSWKIAAEDNINNYIIEKAGADMRFAAAGSVTSLRSNGTSEYTFPDASPSAGNNYYRIKAISFSGEVKYSAIAKIVVNGKYDFSVLQNPVKNHLAQISISNADAGKYSLTLVNAAGQAVFTQNFNHNGGSFSGTLQLPANINAGLYRLSLRGNENIKTATIVVE